MKKIAIISSHPIQYNAPLFAFLAKDLRIDIKVFYTWGSAVLHEKYDPHFQKKIKWDIPLLDGYNYQFIKNISKTPGSHHFNGIINPTLNHEIEIWGAEIVWVWGWAFNSHLKALRYFNGKKEVWFRGDSTMLDEPKGISIKKLLRRIFLKWVYKKVDKAFYVGSHNKDYFTKHGLNEKQLIFAPHAIDSLRFSDLSGCFSDQAHQIRNELGISKKDHLVVFVGKFEPNKNLIELVHKFNNSELKLLLVGNGPEENKIREIAADNIYFLPFQNQSMMPIIYRIGDALILNSKSETWGLVINEAIACGVPVFATVKCGGSIDLINQDNGIVFSNNIELTRIHEFLSNPNLSEQLKRVNSNILNIYSYKSILKAVIQSIK